MINLVLLFLIEATRSGGMLSNNFIEVKYFLGNNMTFIEKSVFLEMVNIEIRKLLNYDSSIEIIDISVNANGLINYFLPNQFEAEKVALADKYIEKVEHLFSGRYNRLI